MFAARKEKENITRGDIMDFWIYMFVMSLLMPVTLLLFGLYFRNKAPKNINIVFGYRTSRSMKNMDTWEFAHRYCGRIWCILGLVILLPTVLAQIPFFHSSEDIIGIVGLIILALQTTTLITPIFLTEAALKKTFYEDGRRR